MGDKRKAPKPRIRMTTGADVPYRKRGKPSGSPVPETMPTAPRGPRNGEAPFEVLMARVRAQLARELEERAEQFIGSDQLPDGVTAKGLGKAWRAIMGNFLLGPRMMRLAMQRCIEDPAFHIRAIDKTIPTPAAVKVDDKGSTTPVLVLGAGLKLKYGNGDGGNGRIKEIEVTTADPPAVNPPGKTLEGRAEPVVVGGPTGLADTPFWEDEPW